MSSSPVFNTLRTLVVLAVLASVGFWIFTSFVSTKSYKGYVNGKIIHLKPSISGILDSKYLEVGMSVKANDLLATVNNPRNVQFDGEQRFLEQKVAIAKAQLTELQGMIAVREAKLETTLNSSNEQSTLRVAYENQNVVAAQGQLAQAKLMVEQAQKDYGRFARMAEKGYVSKQQAEQQKMALMEAQAQLNSASAKLNSENAKLNAAKAGFQVDSALSQNSGESRVLNIENQLMDLKQRRAETETQLLTSQAMLKDLEASNATLRSQPLMSPVDGVLWFVGANDEEFVSENSNVIDVLDCDHLWVDTYIDEQKLKALEFDKPVKIKILSHPELKDVTGKIMVSRSGVGRVSTHEGVALPNEREKSHALVRILVDWPITPDPMQSCYVGSSVETEFVKSPWWEDLFKSKKKDS
jgi:multidrug resistance efflux pump